VSPEDNHAVFVGQMDEKPISKIATHTPTKADIT
jgi:hypothetical protein